MKQKRRGTEKKIALPRRTWQFNPATRVKPSIRVYARRRVRVADRKKQHEE